MTVHVPKPGDYAVTAGGGWPMWWVRRFTFSRYGHAAVVTNVSMSHLDPYPTIVIVEATPDKGVRQRVLRADEIGKWKFSHFVLTDQQRDAIVIGALAQIGKRYDWPSIAGFTVRWWIKKFRGFDPDHPDEKLFCSELVAWLYRDFGHADLFPGVAPGTISPGDLADRMMDADI